MFRRKNDRSFLESYKQMKFYMIKILAFIFILGISVSFAEEYPRITKESSVYLLNESQKLYKSSHTKKKIGLLFMISGSVLLSTSTFISANYDLDSDTQSDLIIYSYSAGISLLTVGTIFLKKGNIERKKANHYKDAAKLSFQMNFIPTIDVYHERAGAIVSVHF